MVTSNYAPFLHDIDAPDHGRAFRVTDEGDNNIRVAAGRCRIDQTVFELAAVDFLALANNNYLVYISAAGAITCAAGVPPFPVNTIPLALVTIAAGDVTDVTDRRCFFYEDLAAGGGYNLVEDEGVPLPQRTTFDFVGAGVTAADIGGETRVTIPGGAGAHNLLDGAVHPDTAAQGASVGSIIRGVAGPLWDELVIAVPGANLRNVLGVDQGDTMPSWKAALDALNPADIAAAAAPGTSLIASHRDHVHAHPNIASDLHNVYALLAGRAGGQTLMGDTGAGGHLTLQSTANAARGYVRSQDDLQLLSNIIRDAAATARVTLAAGLPHVTLAGNTRLGTTVGVSVNPTADIGVNVRPVFTNAIGGSVVAAVPSFIQNAGVNRYWRGLYGEALTSFAAGATGYVRGLDFVAGSTGAGNSLGLTAIYAFLQHAFYTGAALPYMRGLELAAPTYGFVTNPPTDACGIYMHNWGASFGAIGTNLFGLHIVDQTAITGTNYLLEIGNPYLRLLGGGNPPAFMTNLYLREAANLRRVQWMDPGVGGINFLGGERVMVLV